MSKGVYIAAYSREYESWCVYKMTGLNSTEMRLVVPHCIDQPNAEELANLLPDAVTCRGSKLLGSACRKCAKCVRTM